MLGGGKYNYSKILILGITFFTFTVTKLAVNVATAAAGKNGKVILNCPSTENWRLPKGNE